VIGDSWTHKLVRPLVRPLVGTGVTPNHITTARLVTGLLASAMLLPGTALWTWWAGWMWLLSALLDRADGELARVGNMSSLEGQAWDYKVDLIVNPVFFVAIGVGLRDSILGGYAIPLGIIAGGSVYLFTPLAWLDWLMPVMVGAAIGGSFMALLTLWRLWRLIGRQRQEAL
jgi:phosphatidylglycerophosphate synthase